MQQTSVLYKTLVVGVIVLFIGIAIQPSVATVQPEVVDTGYFDVTTEFVGLGKKHTIQLTQKQMDELDVLFESIREQLDKTGTKEETIQIYNEAIVGLDSLGLLGDCSLKQVQELVTGRFPKYGFNRIMNKLNDRIPANVNSNLFCLIAGSASTTLIIPPVPRLVNLITFILDFFGFFYLPLILWVLNFIRIYFLYPWYTLGGAIAIGCIAGWHGYNYHPAEGWFNTYGLFGQKKWEGGLYGQIYPFVFLTTLYFIGAIGFQGVRLYISNMEHSLYLGFATYVKIDNTSPW